ncbi:MAG: TetR/AcrR family transcriptional regulator [Thermodesulfobacteriota bacterium]
MSRPITKLDSIENTAIRLFATKGIKEVTIKEIAREAGCSEGALYRHYTSKDELAWELYKREVEKLGTLLSDILSGIGTYSKRLKQSIELFYTFFDEDPKTFTFILLSEYNFPLESKADPGLNPYNLIFKFIEEGVKAGEFNFKDPILGGAMIQGLVLHPAKLKASGRFEVKIKEKIIEVVEACLRVLKAKKVGAKERY